MVTVPDAMVGDDPTRVVTIVLDLLAQGVDIRLQALEPAIAFGSPHCPDQFFVGDDCPRTIHQTREQTDLCGRQRNMLFATPNLSSSQINAYIPVDKLLLRLLHHRDETLALKKRPYTGYEFQRTHRSRHIVVSTQLQCLRSIRFLLRSDNEHQWKVREPAHQATALPLHFIPDRDSHKNEVRPEAVYQPQSSVTDRSAEDSVAGSVQCPQLRLQTRVALD